MATKNTIIHEKEHTALRPAGAFFVHLCDLSRKIHLRLNHEGHEGHEGSAAIIYHKERKERERRGTPDALHGRARATQISLCPRHRSRNRPIGEGVAPSSCVLCGYLHAVGLGSDHSN